MRLEIVRELDGTLAQDWDLFVASAKHQHPRQSTHFAMVEKAICHGIRYVVGYTGNDVRAVAMASLRNRWVGGLGYSDAATLSGPVCDDIGDFEEFLKGLVKLPDMRRIGRLQISPYWLNEDAARLKSVLDRLGWRSAEDEDFRHTGLVKLGQSDEELLQGLSRSARRKVRLAQRQEITIREMSGNEDCAILYASLNRLRSEKGLSKISTAEAKAQFEYIYADPKLGVALGAYRGSTFVGGLLIYRSNNTAHGRHFCTHTEALKDLSNLRIAPLLWWSGMIWAKDQGCNLLDLEGYNANATPADSKYNIYQYKGEFHPVPATRISEHYFVTNFLLHIPAGSKGWVKVKVKQAMLCVQSAMSSKNTE